MILEKQIEEHVKKVKRLQKDLFERIAKPEDAARPTEMKKARAAELRSAIQRLESEKKAAIERYDAEIRSQRAELAGIERPTDLDLASRHGGTPGRGRGPGKAAGSATKRKTNKG